MSGNKLYPRQGIYFHARSAWLVSTVGAWQIGLKGNDESKSLQKRPERDSKKEAKRKKNEKRKKEEEKDLVNSERVHDLSIS